MARLPLPSSALSEETFIPTNGGAIQSFSACANFRGTGDDACTDMEATGVSRCSLRGLGAVGPDLELNAMFRHVLCVFPYRRTRSSKTSFPPLGLEYVAAALRPHAERIDLVNFRHERTPSTQPFLRPETDLVCYSINWPENLELIRDDINALPPGVMTILGGRTATENPRYWLEACPNVDAVVCGDGEQAIAEIAEGRPWSEIAGLAYRGRRRSIGLQSAAGQRAAGRRSDACPRSAPACVLPDEQGREHGDQDRPGRRVAGLPVQLQVLQLRDQPVGREAALDAAVARVDRPRDRADRRRPDLLRRRRVHASAGPGRRDLRPADRQGDSQTLHRQRPAGDRQTSRRPPQDGAGRVPRPARSASSRRRTRRSSRWARGSPSSRSASGSKCSASRR